MVTGRPGTERFIVVPGRPGTEAVGPVDSATVPRKDGTYVNKLTLRGVVDVDAGQYVCLSTNNAGYSFRRVHLTVFPREYILPSRHAVSVCDSRTRSSAVAERPRATLRGC